jgi:outer membrane protein OmpA-like peptidoglycan-associated protein
MGLGVATAAALLGLSLLTAGCSSSSDTPPPASTTAPAASSSTSTGNESFPNLGTVPDQPPPVTTPEQRQAIVDGLIADRKNAVYSDTPLSGQPSSSVAPPAPPPITPEGGGTTLSPSTITPPANTDTSGAAGASPDSSPDMPATPQTPVSSQPLPDTPAEPPPTGTTVPSTTGVPQPQSNAAPLAPGALQYAELRGGEGMAESDADDFAPASPRLTQLADNGQPATVAADAPRGLIPEGPFGYPQAKPRATAAAPAGNASVAVDLSAIGGAPQGTAPTQRQLQPTQPQLQQASARPPLYVDLSVLDGVSGPAAQTQAPVYQQAAYQQPAYQPAIYQTGGAQWQPNANQLALYQVQPDTRVAMVAPGAVPLPPTGQPLGLIFFANGSSYLNAASREVLHDVARIYRAQGKAIRVVGHASWIPGGNNSFNSTLSYARAQAVAKALAADGVPGGALEMRGVGITQPVFYETASTGIAGNRRADIFLTP